MIQASYAIGVAEPVSIFVNTYGTAAKGLSDSDIAAVIPELFDLRPASIIRKFGLKNPIYFSGPRPTGISAGNPTRLPSRPSMTASRAQRSYGSSAS